MSDAPMVRLSELEKKRTSIKDFLHAKAPFLFDIHSLFYFALTLALLGFFWMGYSLLNNSFTQLYGWDYQSQFVTMAYGFHDTWQKFFKTGYFELYSTNTYLGVDQIGANAYYGLFDPFMLVAYILTPRSWIPQMYALLTIVKGMVGGLGMRWYCRYLGVKESSSRLGAVAFAFNGYVNFMVGFPTMVSAAVLVPFVLLGIEKVLKDRKPYLLSLSLPLMGMSSFFFLVVICLFGVFYALIRYFMTWKLRSNVKEQLSTVGLGFLGFLFGIMLGAWVLFPSLRESTISGRTTSIGALYLENLVRAIEEFDIGSLFASLFQMVGNHPIREMQGITSFLFPTVNYLWLPLAKPVVGATYDSWTASIFTYTPIVILFCVALVSAIRRKKIGELLIFALCSYLLFTNFAYYFFYAFAGDGYGRWYLVLVPLIVYYGVREFDRIKEEPKWVVATGAGLSLALAITVWCLYALYFNGMDFEPPSNQPVTYWPNQYDFPAWGSRDGIIHSLQWMVYYQFALYAIGGAALIVFRYRKHLVDFFIAMVAVETIVAGNCSFIYGSSWSYEYNYNGGRSFAEAMTKRMSEVNDDGEGRYYRVNIEGLVERNTQIAFGVNGTSHFDSLYNYETAALNAYSRLDTGGWSAYYGNKRLGLDMAFGIGYYAVRGEGYGSGFDFGAPNVPFDSELIVSDDQYRVYRSSLPESLYFSWMSENIYAEDNENTAGASGTGLYSSPWHHPTYSGTAAAEEVLRNEEIYLSGSIIKDADKERISKLGLGFETAPSFGSTAYDRSWTSASFKPSVYKTVDTYTYYGPVDGTMYGPTAFYDPKTRDLITTEIEPYSLSVKVESDFEKIVLEPRGEEYFNKDERGAYFAMYIPGSMGNVRVYMIGDRFDENGEVSEEYALLNYEYAAINNWNSYHVSSAGPVYGFYPDGRVRAIVFLGKPSERSDYYVAQTLRIYMMERSTLEEFLKPLQESALEDIVYTSDRFEGKGHFARAGIMNTVLAYDEGWHVYLDDGERSFETEKFNVNGGFLGYYVPEGDYTVTLCYMTPYLELAAILYTAAFFGLTAVFLGKTAISYRKKLKENGESLELRIRR